MPRSIAVSHQRVFAGGGARATDYTSPAAWVGALVEAPQPQRALSQSSARGVTTSGPFDLSTKVVRVGQYVTVRIATTPPRPGVDIGIWIARKAADGTWSAFSPHTGRIANAAGVVFYYYRAGSPAWLSFQARIGADSTHPATAGNAVQARWLP